MAKFIHSKKFIYFHYLSKFVDFFYIYINIKIAYENQQDSTSMNNHQLRQVARSAQNDFGVWVRNATDKGRK